MRTGSPLATDFALFVSISDRGVRPLRNSFPAGSKPWLRSYRSMALKMQSPNSDGCGDDAAAAATVLSGYTATVSCAWAGGGSCPMNCLLYPGGQYPSTGEDATAVADFRCTSRSPHCRVITASAYT